MDLDLGARGVALREEMRAFLADNLTPELREVAARAPSAFCDPPYALEWQRILHAKGWAAPAWPVEHGGPGWNVIERFIYAEESARAGAPVLPPNGLRMVGPCIIGHGTPAQHAEYLPKILSGEHFWAQGYSEPGAGSDLASLRLRADSDGDHYVLNGSKTWTSHAQYANRMFCLARTRFDGKPQNGISFLLFDMATPGITVRPIYSLAGDHELNEVFFDNVRVPKSGRLGAENEGWGVAKYLLEFERGKTWGPGLKVAVDRLRETARAEASDSGDPLIADPRFRARLAEFEVLLSAIEMTEHRVMAALSAGRNPGPASSMLKTQATEAMQRLDELTLDAAGRYGGVQQFAARQPNANLAFVGPEHSLTAMARYLNNRAGSIYGGTNEVQRNIMARLLLDI